MAAMPSLEMVESQDAAACALHPIRREMLVRLNEPKSASALAEEIGIPRQKANYHLKELESHGLVEAVDRRQRRGLTEVLMRRKAAAVLLSPSLLGLRPQDAERSRLSAAWQIARSLQLIDEVSRMQVGAEQAGKKLPTFTIEAEVRVKSPARLKDFAEEAAVMLAELADRYAEEAGEESRTFRLMLAGHPKPKEEK